MASKNNSYKPRPSDILWTSNLIQSLRDKAVWLIPMDGSVYQIDKQAKKLIQIKAPSRPGPYDMVERLTANFAANGYVVEIPDDSAQQCFTA